MSTTPVQADSTHASTATQAAPVTTPDATTSGDRPNYDNEDFPVLSFLFALHCDAGYSDRTYAGYLKDETDKSYLNNYVRGTRRTFPPGAIHLIHDVVPENPADENGHFPPTRGQSSRMIAQFMLPELAYVATSSDPVPVPPVDLAFFVSDRPLISSMGMIFLNGDRTFDVSTRRDLLGDEVVAALQNTMWAPNGRPFLSASDVLTLLPKLVDEFALGRAVW